MQPLLRKLFAFSLGLALLGYSPASSSLRGESTTERREQADGATTRFLIVGKGRVADPPAQQERGVEAVKKVARAAKAAQPDAVVDALAEEVMTIEQYRRGEAREKVTGAIFRERLRRLAADATPKDTVFIYTHTHGRQDGFEKSQPLGGIVMDLPVRQPAHGGTLLWDEYADLLLKIPAKNVIVLTMACFAGGFVDHLNSPPVGDGWKERQSKHGRNLVILTSQNRELTSDPIMKNGELINPFTYAVATALEGEADGFGLKDGKPLPRRQKDGKLTVGELIDYILYTTENTLPETARPRNTAKPQLTGSFNREAVLLERTAAVH